MDGDQKLSRVQVQRDESNPKRLLFRYGNHVVATLSVRGAVDVNSIQVRDRTGARNQGGIIDTIDVDVVHPPGVTVVLDVSRKALARTKKEFGISNVKAEPVAAKPPYREDELQVWPPKRNPGGIRQRRPLSVPERDELEQWRAQSRAEDIDIGGQIVALRRDYAAYRAIFDQSKWGLEQLRGIRLLGIIPPEVPSSTIWNDLDEQMYLAAKALDYRFPGRAKVHLARATAAWQTAEVKVRAALKKMMEDNATAGRVVTKIGQVSDVVGRAAASRLPPPLSTFFGFLYDAAHELSQPEPTTFEETVERMEDRARGLIEAAGTRGIAPRSRVPSPENTPVRKPPKRGSARSGMFKHLSGAKPDELARGLRDPATHDRFIEAISGGRNREAARQDIRSLGTAIAEHVKVSPDGKVIVDRAVADAVWSLDPRLRGVLIESTLGHTKYASWFNAGALKNGFFPDIDFAKTSTGRKYRQPWVSVKSVYPGSKSYHDTLTYDLTTHIDTLATGLLNDIKAGQRPAPITLDVRVPQGWNGSIPDARRILNFAIPREVKSLIKVEVSNF